MNTILVAYLLDLIWGDPHWLPHPVKLIGKLIETGEDFLRYHIKNLRTGGIILTAAITLGIYLVTLGVLGFLAGYGWLKWVVSALLIYYCFSLRALAKAADRVFNELNRGNLRKAREQLSHMVGRDTQTLDEPGIIRATVESVAENTVDGFISPLFYAMVGGAPLCLAYKAINTLDSMIGYKSAHYREFGWAAARLDDFANYFPSRLMYGLLPIAAGTDKAGITWHIMQRDGRKHPSPNSGIPEAGFAAALTLQLGGMSYYQGQVHDKPLLGEDETVPEPVHIKQAVRLMYRVSIWSIGLSVLLLIIF
jgi:adenosylcobinamide-phosphate synthase